MTRINEAGKTRIASAMDTAAPTGDDQPVYPHTMRLQRFWRARAWRAAAARKT